MAKGNDPASHGVTNFVNSGADGRFNVFAALGIGKAFPSTPSLNHEISLSIIQKGGQERDN
jgi:hypothetical protein